MAVTVICKTFSAAEIFLKPTLELLASLKNNVLDLVTYWSLICTGTLSCETSPRQVCAFLCAILCRSLESSRHYLLFSF